MFLKQKNEGQTFLRMYIELKIHSTSETSDS